MNTRRWLVDYDSTIADMNAVLLAAINNRFGTTYTHDTFYTWDTEACMTKEHSDFMWSEEGFFNEANQLAAPPIEGAIESILRLHDAGEQLMIVSDRKPSLYEVTRNWLDNQGLGFIRLLFTQSEYGAQTTGGKKGMSKMEAAARFGLTYIIEDAPHHAEAFRTLESIDYVYLLNKPWNQGIPDGPRLTRVSGWPELNERIQYATAYEWATA